MHQFTELIILLGIAGLTIPLLHRLKVSPVLGYLICGILMGPTGLATWMGDTFWVPSIEDDEMIKSFSELGIVFLMFMIGLKLSLKDLWRMRHYIFGLGGCQIMLTGAVVAVFAFQFENSLHLAILLGACFALSSTAVVMQLLEEKDQVQQPVGKLTFSILLMQDLAVVPILALLTAYATRTDEPLLLLTAKALALAALAIVAIYFAGMKILQPLLRYIKPGRRQEWLLSFVLFVVIGAAMLTEKAGLSAALGAFLAGLLLAETEHKDEVQGMISPVRNLLMGVFFLSIGMMIDIRMVFDNAVWIFASVVGIGFLKAGILFGLCLAFKVDKKTAAESSILLGQSGEFVFVIVTMALAHSLISAIDAQFFMIVTAMSMLVTPFVAALAPVVAKKVAGLFPKKRA